MLDLETQTTDDGPHLIVRDQQANSCDKKLVGALEDGSITGDGAKNPGTAEFLPTSEMTYDEYRCLR